MSIDSYLMRAKTVGVAVSLFPASELEDRLSSLLRELKPNEAMLPKAGWPEGLLQNVESALAKGEVAAVSPIQGENGSWRWERDNAARAKLGVTFCPAFIAETGSLAFPAGPGLGTLASLLPDAHLAVSFLSAHRETLGAYLGEFRQLPSRLSFVSGPSRTGDIEASMTTCVHGPGKVFHFILEDR